MSSRTKLPRKCTPTPTTVPEQTEVRRSRRSLGRTSIKYDSQLFYSKDDGPDSEAVKQKPVIQKPVIQNGQNHVEQKSAEQKSAKQKPVKLVEPVKLDSIPAVIDDRAECSKVECPVPCREAQFDEIWNFLRQGVENKDSRCLYVSGVPGTGKTLIVKAVVEALERVSTESFQHIFVNSLNLGIPDRIWNRVYKGLGFQGSSKIASSQAFKKVEHFLHSNHLPVILIVDELDQLLDKRQNILYRILEWASHPVCRFSFIAIFNTMNLPETTLASRNVSRMGFARVVFAPYTHQQLQLIVSNHLGEAKTGQLQTALTLLSKKVAGISGDARRAIEIANRTLEIMERNGQSGTKAIQEAFKELFASPHIHCLKNCSKLEKEIIRRLATILEASGTEETLLKNVINGVIDGAGYEGYRWSVDQILAATSRLFAMRLILIETTKPSIHGKITLEVAVEDVNYAFGINSTED